MKQLLILGFFTLFVACGSSSIERGIPATTNDTSASGSAYKSSDGFAPENSSNGSQPPAIPAASIAVNTDSATVPAIGPAVPVATPDVSATAVVAPTPAKSAATDDSSDIKKGQALISKSDCLACHKVDVKVLGPSYKDVANKYPNNAATVNQLVDKIKKGGSGVWGAIPMSPHPALSDDDARAMVKYILSLK